MALEWKEIIDTTDELLKQTLSLYHSCFPEYVREDNSVFYESIRQREKNIPNHFHFLVGVMNEKIVSFATAHYLADINSGYIVYLAADPKERGKGYGKQTLLKMEELLGNDATHAGHPSLTGLFLETEREIDAKNEEEYRENINRLQFFNHLGLRPVKECNYLQPPLYKEQTPVPLYLAFKPIVSGAEPDCERAIKAIYYEKYHKMNHVSLSVHQDCMASSRIGHKKHSV